MLLTRRRVSHILYKYDGKCLKGYRLLYANKWTAEEFCNTLLTLCHITDKMMCSYLARFDKQFVE